MTTTLSWAAQYLLAAIIAFFAGPVLSNLPAAQSLPYTLFGLSSPHTLRLVVEAAGLTVLGWLAIRAFRQMPDNGRGFSFLRQLVLPVTMLLIVIATDKTLRGVGQPLIHQLGSAHYTFTHAIILALAGLWATVAWLMNLNALHRFFSTPSPPAGRKEAAASIEETYDGREDNEEVEEEKKRGEHERSLGFQAAPSGPPPMLGRYKVLKELGRGAMGVVYLGKDPTIQRLVAIKTMRLDAIDDADKLQEVKGRFFREAESTGRLSHPNIVTIFDAGEEHELVYIAMELLQGTTLKDWSRKPNLMPVPRVVSILATVAEAMDYAHQQGVVHRDIKPANIMMTNGGGVKIMDFGIAKMATSMKTQTNLVMGTPTYMSPEQIAGRKVDGRSDLFSLGVVMFELLTGQPPFWADNVSALLFAIAHTPHPSLQAVRPDLPPTLKNVLDRALHKDAVHRYRRAGEFATELRSCVESLAA